MKLKGFAELMREEMAETGVTMFDLVDRIYEAGGETQFLRLAERLLNVKIAFIDDEDFYKLTPRE